MSGIPVADGGEDPRMDQVWQRISEELTRKKKSVAWLATRMNADRQRVYNWGRRGVPVSAYPEIAAALGKSIDWVAGRQVELAAADLSPMALRIAHEFDRIKDEATQLATFAHMIGVIARATESAPEPPTRRPALPPTDEPTRSR